MPNILIINPRSGDETPGPDELAAEARRHDIAVHVLREGEEPGEVAREAKADIVGMAGGDGSLAAVAGAAIERDLPFVCVPFGTRNHFARDLGLDRADPIGALAAFSGEERRIDVGRVGDRLFLNNVSLGLYAGLVHRRERHRRRRIALARLRALAILLRRPEPLGLQIDGQPVSAHVILVANNSYTLEPLSIGERERLDDGHLHLYLADGLLPGSWDERTGKRFTLDASVGRLDAAVDGEPEGLKPPVEFSIEPASLRVLLPARPH